MTTFRYDTSGTWFKGNTHIHTPASDGGKTPGELAEMYAAVGYDFLFRTDHNTSSAVASEKDEYPLLWLDGVELGGRDDRGSFYHVACLGSFDGIDTEMGLMDAMAAVREQGGILILAHPSFCGNSFEDALRWGFDGVEIYNHVVHWLNGKGDAIAYYNAMLEANPNTLGLAVDDTHACPEHPGYNGGWVVVNSPQLTRDAILDAIRRGNFYSSCGPEIHEIAFDGESVTVETSPVQFVRLVGRTSNGRRVGNFDGQLRTQATFEMPPDWEYAYLEIEDAAGKRAWTNPLFITS